MKIYATRLGLIPSSEIAFALRVESERRRREEARAEDARERAARRRERWARFWAGTRSPRVA